MTKEKKTNIDDVANREFMKKTSLPDLIKSVERHVKEQDNGCERTPVLLQEILDYYPDNPARARREIQWNIGTYAYWNGGACQDLD